MRASEEDKYVLDDIQACTVEICQVFGIKDNRTRVILATVSVTKAQNNEQLLKISDWF